MSLTSFIKMADVKDKLKQLRPGPLRKIPAALRVEPRSKRYPVVGSAFDYLLRFELRRRAPHAMARCWTAELAPDLIWQHGDRGTGSFMNLSKDDQGTISVLTVRRIVGQQAVKDPHAGLLDPMEMEELAKEVAGRVRPVIEKANLAHAGYLKNTSPTRPEQAELAGHAIRLAKLDDLPAARRFDSTFEEAAAEDVEDLLAMLAIVPFNVLLHDKTLLLNPVFGQMSLWSAVPTRTLSLAICWWISRQPRATIWRRTTWTSYSATTFWPVASARLTQCSRRSND